VSTPHPDLSSAGDARGELHGQVAVITGAGGGIGRAIAELLAEQGAHIVGVDRRKEPLAGLVRSIVASGGSAEFITADVADAESVERCMAASRDNHDSLDILVNCAGVIVPPTPIAEFDVRSFDHLMGVNVKGVFLCMRFALPIMINQGRGVVLNIGSVTSVKTIAGLGPYAASKRAVTALTRAAALEVGPQGIRVNELLPGPTLTRMVTGPADAPTGAEASFASEVPLGRVSLPAEQAEAALFLVSARSSYINGASLLADGGLAWA
jgi:NAD(P)-dependent dehydrogenase (short-subunit alcohol dehydrogenase family)